MQLRKAHYVTACQVGLVLLCVLAIAVAATGVVSLNLVEPKTSHPGQPNPKSVAPAIQTGDAYVAKKAVEPKVREVPISTRTTATPVQAPAAQPAPTKSPAPKTAKKATKSTKSTDSSAGDPTADPKAKPGDTIDAGGLKLAADSGEQHVGGMATVGATWDEAVKLGESDVASYVRTLKGSTWSTWQKLEYHSDHGPDSEEEEGTAHERNGTEPSVVGHVDGVELRTYTRSGQAPAGLRLALIDPGADQVKKAAPALDTATAPGTVKAEQKAAKDGNAAELSAMTTAPKPTIYSRAQWGADERIRDQSAPSYGTVQTGFVHHTVNANDYTAEQVPALLRGIYAYHVQSRGWRDIGYNFLIDRFGRIWEGRYGGIDKAVIGAHTKGYNEVSFAASAIGNYDVAQPSQEVINAYASLFAWKLSMYGISANATGINVKGKILNAINGHRDVGQTACPGQYLYAQIPQIRALATQIQGGGSVGGPSAGAPTSSTPSGPPAKTTAINPVPAESLPKRSNVVGSSWPDLVVRDKATGAVSIVPTGGQFGLQRVGGGGSFAGYDVVAPLGDVTGDGKGDLFVRTKKSGAARVLAGDGSGGFAALKRSLKAYSSYRWITGAGDLTGDGKGDLVARSGSQLVLIKGKGNGRFKKAVSLRSWKGNRLIGVGDLTGDGRADLATVTAKHQVVLYRYQKGTLAKAGKLPVTAKSSANLVGGADVTGDGRSDVITRRASGSTWVYPGTGAGTVGAAYGPFGSLSGVSKTAAGAVLGGSGGIVGVDANGSLAVLGGNGRTNLGSPVAVSGKFTDTSVLLNVGDWNRDGKSDLMTHKAGSDLVGLRLGDGNGGFGAAVKMKGFAQATNLAAVGDVTGDGNPDLAGRTSAGQWLVWPGDGKQGVGGPVVAPGALRSFNQIGSGLWNAAGGQVLSSADGTFVPLAGSPGSPSASLAGYDWVLGVGDADGDGVSDLVVREQSTGNLYLLPGLGSGGVGTRRLIATGFGGYDLAG